MSQVTEQVAGIPITSTHCDFAHLPQMVQQFVEEKARICQPKEIYICDGSEEENRMLLARLVEAGQIQKLESMQNCWLALTDPKDVARVESRTFISTPEAIETISVPAHGFTDGTPDLNLRGLKCSALGNWMAPEDLEYELGRRLPNCMNGRTMYGKINFGFKYQTLYEKYKF